MLCFDIASYLVMAIQAQWIATGGTHHGMTFVALGFYFRMSHYDGAGHDQLFECISLCCHRKKNKQRNYPASLQTTSQHDSVQLINMYRDNMHNATDNEQEK